MKERKKEARKKEEKIARREEKVDQRINKKLCKHLDPGFKAFAGVCQL